MVIINDGDGEHAEISLQMEFPFPSRMIFNFKMAS